MQLTDKVWENAEKLEKMGYYVPKFDRKAVAEQTKQEPEWIHFGAGNIFRAFPAMLMQKLIENGKSKTGIIVAEGYDYEIIDAYRKHDGLSVLATLKADGNVDKTITASIVESLKADPKCAEEFERLKEIFRAKSLKLVSFTITEKGYCLTKADGSYTDAVKQDFMNGPESPISYIGIVTSLCYERFLAGKLPLALVSMDNCSHNGSKLKDAVSAYAKKWEENHVCEEGFLAYIKDENTITFPWTMIDKITPRPDDSVGRMLADDGWEGFDGIQTGKHTYIAPFVNAEETEYLVVEDAFPNGRPELEDAGVIFTDRKTVDQTEKMKVGTCLNPLHTSLAVFGCLLSYDKIYQEMQDEELKELVNRVGYEEGLPVVINPGILDPKAFLEEVLTKRIPNPFMPDTPVRIATDTSQKIPVRFGETIKAYGEDAGKLTCIPLVIAGWLRYLLGINDDLEAMEISPDPLYPYLKESLKDAAVGKGMKVHDILYPLLTNEKIFVTDLYKTGLGAKIEGFFTEMTAGKGAVRSTLKKYVHADGTK
ncbi:MAG: mannitol dehydrogenase family protein [Lachnospiraceae bacterium]|nr:mannitol dehydrogenase family protein [Lachnospiraceae bacterium]